MKDPRIPVILPQCRPAASAPVSEGAPRDRVAEAAYYRAQKRGFAPGHELEDWLAAESEIAHLLLATAA
jgi:hypothetical protein